MGLDGYVGGSGDFQRILAMQRQREREKADWEAKLVEMREKNKAALSSISDKFGSSSADKMEVNEHIKDR